MEFRRVLFRSDLITIPMGGRAESLNAAAAATVLLWELLRGGESDGTAE